jgi:hypothetical protein
MTWAPGPRSSCAVAGTGARLDTNLLLHVEIILSSAKQQQVLVVLACFPSPSASKVKEVTTPPHAAAAAEAAATNSTRGRPSRLSTKLFTSHWWTDSLLPMIIVLSAVTWSFRHQQWDGAKHRVHCHVTSHFHEETHLFDVLGRLWRQTHSMLIDTNAIPKNVLFSACLFSLPNRMYVSCHKVAS